MSYESIGRLIKERREKLGISLETIAQNCGVNRSTVSRWESGRTKDIKRAHIEILSKLLYLPIETLLGLDTDEEIEDEKIVLKRMEIINLVNKIKDDNKLENIKKYIEVFGL